MGVRPDAPTIETILPASAPEPIPESRRFHHDFSQGNLKKDEAF